MTIEELRKKLVGRTIVAVGNSGEGDIRSFDNVGWIEHELCLILDDGTAISSVGYYDGDSGLRVSWPGTEMSQVLAETVK